MTIETRDFGTLTILDEEIITFVYPILGFEMDKTYVILADDESDGMFSWLQSTTNDQICFVLINPLAITSEYNPTLPISAKQLLGITDNSEVIYRAIAVIPEDIQKATANLKGPIVICPNTKRAAQVLLDDDYPLRAPLLQTEE